jgi:hypothetical protein
VGPDEPEQPPEELVEEREGHGRAAWPTASELVKPDMGVIGPFRTASELVKSDMGVIGPFTLAGLSAHGDG